MFKSAEYIYNNIIKADEVNTTREYCKKAQVGVDLSARHVNVFDDAGTVLKSKTYASHTSPIETKKDADGDLWILDPGTYIVTLNEGCAFGPNDTGFIILRSSLNRCGVSIDAAVWDPGYTSVSGDEVLPMSVRLTVQNPHGFILERNARIAQLVVADSEDTSIYDGQWQGGRTTSKLV